MGGEGSGRSLTVGGTTSQCVDELADLAHHLLPLDKLGRAGSDPSLELRDAVVDLRESRPGPWSPSVDLSRCPHGTRPFNPPSRRPFRDDSDPTSGVGETRGGGRDSRVGACPTSPSRHHNPSRGSRTPPWNGSTSPESRSGRTDRSQKEERPEPPVFGRPRDRKGLRFEQRRVIVPGS